MTGKRSTRTANPSDIARICEIDTDASSKFATISALEELAQGSHGHLQPRAVENWLADGTIYAVEEADCMLGFVTVEPRDGLLYVAELSVLLDHQGRGLGSMLLEKACEHARQSAGDAGSSIARVSLTTYPDVPWNGPWYRKRGFKEVDPAELGSWHIEKVRQDEKDLARPGYRRCCMLWEGVSTTTNSSKQVRNAASPSEQSTHTTSTVTRWT